MTCQICLKRRATFRLRRTGRLACRPCIVDIALDSPGGAWGGENPAPWMVSPWRDPVIGEAV